MSRKRENVPAAEAPEAEATPPEATSPTATDEAKLREDAASTAETETQIALPRSVVGVVYKNRYLARAQARGDTSKEAKRSVWSWLEQELAAATLTPEKKTDVAALVRFLEANGIADPLTRWPNRSKGWQGRLRMSGGNVLRSLVAQRGELSFPVQNEDGTWGTDTKPAPESWLERYRR